MFARVCLRDRDIVCVGFADWDADLWTNQHHLMSRLAADNRVLFVESLGLRRPQLAGRDLRRIGRRLRRGVAPPRTVDGLHVLSPLVLPLHDRPWARRLNASLLRRQAGRATGRLGFRDPLLWSYVPQAEALLDSLRPSQVVYHCVDDIAAQKGVAADAFRSAEARFATRADLVLARRRRSPAACASWERACLMPPTWRTPRGSPGCWSRATSTRPSRRCRARGWCSPARSWRRSSTCRS
jgi:hypothetical protein